MCPILFHSPQASKLGKSGRISSAVKHRLRCWLWGWLALAPSVPAHECSRLRGLREWGFRAAFQPVCVPTTSASLHPAAHASCTELLHAHSSMEKIIPVFTMLLACTAVRYGSEGLPVSMTGTAQEFALPLHETRSLLGFMAG